LKENLKELVLSDMLGISIVLKLGGIWQGKGKHVCFSKRRKKIRN